MQCLCCVVQMGFIGKLSPSIRIRNYFRDNHYAYMYNCVSWLFADFFTPNEKCQYNVHVIQDHCVSDFHIYKHILKILINFQEMYG